jgi:DNA-binding PadR family transcriptional regulator
MYSSELLKGSLQTIILKLLAEQGRMYGYEITQRVKELSASEIQLTEGALYPTLHKLEAEGLLTTETVNIGKRIRKYYSLTPEGKNTAAMRVQEFMDFVATMKVILSTKPDPGL